MKYSYLALLSVAMVACADETQHDDIGAAEDSEAEVDAVADSAPAEVDAVADSAPAEVDAVADSAPAEVDAVEDSAPAEVDAVEDSAPAEVDAVEDSEADTAVEPTGSVRVSVRTASGDPVVGAEVVAGDVRAETDAAGIALLVDLPAGAALGVAAYPTGSAPGWQIVTPKGGDEVQVGIDIPPSLARIVEPAPDSSSATNVAGTELLLPPDGFLVGPDGVPYSGAVEVRVAEIDEAARGPDPEETSIDGPRFSPMALFELTLRGAPDSSDGPALQPTAPIPFRRELALDDATVAALGAGDVALQLLSFDRASGQWRDAGALTYEGGVVSGALPHFSLFQVAPSPRVGSPTVDAPAACANGRVMRGGSPVAGASVTFKYWIKLDPPSSLSVYKYEQQTTDASGRFCMVVPQKGQGGTVYNYGGTQLEGTYSGSSFRVEYFEVNGERLPPPPHPESGGEVCSASCVAWGDVVLAAPAPPPACAASAALCDDRDPCTVDSCDAAAVCPAAGCSGCKHTIASGAACDDRDACTVGDACDAGGKCVGTTGVSCDDGDACTTDLCDTLAGGCRTVELCAYDPHRTCSAGPPVACGCLPGYAVSTAGKACISTEPTCAALADALEAATLCPTTYARAGFVAGCDALDPGAANPCTALFEAYVQCGQTSPAGAYACDATAAGGVAPVDGPCRAAGIALVGCDPLQVTTCADVADAIVADLACGTFDRAVFVPICEANLSVPTGDPCVPQAQALAGCLVDGVVSNFGCGAAPGVELGGIHFLAHPTCLLEDQALSVCRSCGTPSAETCNVLDDDCDGYVDEEPTADCAASGLTCVAGACR